MKNFKKIASSFLLTFVVLIAVACGNGEKNSTYNLETPNEKTNVILYHKDGNVNKIEADSVVPINMKAMLPEQQAQFKQAIENVEKVVKELNGVEVKFDSKDSEFSVKMTVDYSKVDFEQLKEFSTKRESRALPLRELEKLNSLKEAESVLTKGGFKKK